MPEVQMTISSLVVQVHGHALDECTNNHLTDLSDGDHPGRKWWLDLERHQAIVAIHDRMHSVVHGHEVECLASLSGVCVPAVEQNSHVMVPVQKDEWTFANDDVECVPELWNFGEDEKLDPKPGGTDTPC